LANLEIPPAIAYNVTMRVLEKDKVEALETEVLDAATLAALDDGLKMADKDPRRWTPEQVRADARAMAKEWRQKITQQNGA
jgi:hypothetical protein